MRRPGVLDPVAALADRRADRPAGGYARPAALVVTSRDRRDRCRAARRGHPGARPLPPDRRDPRARAMRPEDLVRAAGLDPTIPRLDDSAVRGGVRPSTTPGSARPRPGLARSSWRRGSIGSRSPCATPANGWPRWNAWPRTTPSGPPRPPGGWARRSIALSRRIAPAGSRRRRVAAAVEIIRRNAAGPTEAAVEARSPTPEPAGQSSAGADRGRRDAS